MKRRSFLALLGAAPAVALIPADLYGKSIGSVIRGAKITDAKITSIDHEKIMAGKISVNAVVAGKIGGCPITAEQLAVGSIRYNQIQV